MLDDSAAHQHTLRSKAVFWLLTTKPRDGVYKPFSWADSPNTHSKSYVLECGTSSLHYSPGSAIEGHHPANMSLCQAFNHLSRPKPFVIYQHQSLFIEACRKFMLDCPQPQLQYIPRDSALTSCKAFKLLQLKPSLLEL